eukprot:9688134-Karenia_brevis.AAC.1
MHQTLIKNEVEEVANKLGIDKSGIPAVALMQKQTALRELDIMSLERTTSAISENESSISQIDARETNKLL